MSNVVNLDDGAVSREMAGQQVLIFSLRSEEYGIDIQKVQELRGYEAVTRIANAPDYVKGVVNLRGTIVPILDLRIKIGIPALAYDQFTVVIIVNFGGRVVGIVVDSVADVLTLSGEQIKPAPQVGGSLDVNYLLGIASIDERMLILVDIERLLGAELGIVQQLAA